MSHAELFGVVLVHKNASNGHFEAGVASHTRKAGDIQILLSWDSSRCLTLPIDDAIFHANCSRVAGNLLRFICLTGTIAVDGDSYRGYSYTAEVSQRITPGLEIGVLKSDICTMDLFVTLHPLHFTVKDSLRKSKASESLALMGQVLLWAGQSFVRACQSRAAARVSVVRNAGPYVGMLWAQHRTQYIRSTAQAGQQEPPVPYLHLKVLAQDGPGYSTRCTRIPRGYPDNDDDKSLSANLLFYQNKQRCRPDNLTIDVLHDKWQGDFGTLEYKHGFIQWLFPIQEFGMNYESQPLQRHELEAMKSSPEVIERILTSYKLMLDFYGMRLEDEQTGRLARVLPPAISRQGSTHNNLRISRILKCLSEMGLERLNAGFLLHVLNEQSEHDELSSRMLVSSMDRWWANCLRDETEREWIGQLIKKVRGDWTFTREMYERVLKSREAGQGLRLVEELAGPSSESNKVEEAQPIDTPPNGEEQKGEEEETKS
ncbi:hypothetical protein BDZ89DRAFT_1044061 [Hymenopellis radicata]|nr:hypothetical protein BDZ89DRAFT_1044061 [Hymenopellis radicata]